MPAGAGHDGFCKICAHEQAPRMIKAARDGANAAQALEIASLFGLYFDRKTWYAHKQHAITGEGRILQAAEKVRREGALTVGDIKKSNNTELLSAIRDIGMAKALNNPDDITVDQALKAVQILEAREKKGGDQLNVLVQFVTGNVPAVVVEGEYKEIAAHGSDRPDPEPAGLP
jgi:hypothetical protein